MALQRSGRRALSAGGRGARRRASSAAPAWSAAPEPEPLPLPPGAWRPRALVALPAPAAGAACLLGWLCRDAAELDRAAGAPGGAGDGDVLAVWAAGGGGATGAGWGLRGWRVAAEVTGGPQLACLAAPEQPGASFGALAGARLGSPACPPQWRVLGWRARPSAAAWGRRIAECVAEPAPSSAHGCVAQRVNTARHGVRRARLTQRVPVQAAGQFVGRRQIPCGDAARANAPFGRHPARPGAGARRLTRWGAPRRRCGGRRTRPGRERRAQARRCAAAGAPAQRRPRCVGASVRSPGGNAYPTACMHCAAYAPRPSTGRPARHACNHIIAATAHRPAAQPPRACTARCGARLLSARLVPRLCPRGASTPRRLAASAVPNPIPYTRRCRCGHRRRARRPLARSGRGDRRPCKRGRRRRRRGDAVARGGRQPRAALRVRGARRAARSAQQPRLAGRAGGARVCGRVRRPVRGPRATRPRPARPRVHALASLTPRSLWRRRARRRVRRAPPACL